MSKKRNLEKRAKAKLQKAALRLVKALTPEQQANLARSLNARD
jgi:hypothetical protein